MIGSDQVWNRVWLLDFYRVGSRSKSKLMIVAFMGAFSQILFDVVLDCYK